MSRPHKPSPHPANQASHEQRRTSAVQTDDLETVRVTARATEPDWYVAALLAPGALRHDLIALAAFGGEIRRIGHDVHDIMAAEIRLQWWRDALKAGAGGTATGHPVADACSKAIRRHNIALHGFDDFLDAHAHALYQAPPPDANALMSEIDLKEGTLFRASARILAGPNVTPADHDAIAAAAKAYGLMRVALDLPYALARARQSLPDVMICKTASSEPDWSETTAALARAIRISLADARRAFRTCQRAIRPAILPAALVEPYLGALEKQGHDPARDIAEIAPLTRMWRMYYARWRGQL